MNDSPCLGGTPVAIESVIVAESLLGTGHDCDPGEI